MTSDRAVPAAIRHSSSSAWSREIDCVPATAWDETVAMFDDGHYEQTACWAGTLHGARDSHLLLRRDGVAVAGARVVIRTLPPFAGGLAFLRFGPFWRRRGCVPDLDVYRAVIAELVDEYCGRRGHCLTVIPRPGVAHHRRECDALDELGFVVRRPMPDPNRYVVDVAPDEGAMMRGFEQKWRYNLRQALSRRFDIGVCESADDVAAFQALHAAMVARKSFTDPAPIHLVARLAAELPAALRPRLVLARHDGVPIAGATVAVFGDTAYYVFGASADAALPLKGGYALQWWILRWLAGQGVRWYDLGGEAEQQGLRQFKKGMIGKRGALVVMDGEHDRWTAPAGRVVADLIYGLRGIRNTLRSIGLAA